MKTSREAALDGSGPVGGGRFAWRSCALWLPACVILGVGVAWTAVVAQGYFAPFIIFPLLVGVGLGALIVGLMRFGQVGNRFTVLLGTLLAMAVTIVGQHYISYLMAYRWPWQEVTTRQHPGQDLSGLANVWIPSFPEFMRGQAARGRPPLTDYVGPAAVVSVTWALWAVDGLLVMAAALAMVVPAVRQPYCNRCRSWYRVIRSGRIDALTTTRLAELAHICLDEQPSSTRYRLLNCQEGCGATGFALFWQEPRGPAFSAQTWLDAECRDRMVQVLDEASEEESRQ